MNKWRRSFKLHYMYFVALQVNNCRHFLTQLNMDKHEVNTTRNAPMCLKRSPSTNELVSTVLSQLIYLFLNVRGKWNVQPSFVQKKIPYLLKTWWFMRLFSFRYFNIYEVKKRQVYFVIYTCTAIWKKTKKIIYFDISFTGIWNLKRLGIYNKTLVEICREVLRKLKPMLERE